ncbi:MAG TPA: sulfatase [Candidatus Acidoferrales bacterium]|jgi:arylsulfatase A-like enzyme|nr:sulfatase [Candidatus Acidoferrales bacterium]
MNVIVICSDTFRYDHLGFTGRQQVVTPNLDQLARESACFSDFWLCSFPTLVNRIEVFSGRYTFPLMDWGPLPFQFPVLAEVFKHHGFATALLADNLHLMQDGFGFGRGFDFVKNVPGQLHDHFQPPTTPMIDLPCAVEKLEPKPNRLERYRRNAYWYKQQNTNTTETVFRETMRWLDRPPGKFFLWLDTFDPHEPWDAPEHYLRQYPWNPAGDRVFWPYSGKASRYCAADLENMRSLYKSEVSQTDFWVGQLLAHLRKNQLLEETAVIFCSDHGYYFGEHGMLGKPLKSQLSRPTTIYEELGHIPLLVRHPRGIGAGTTVPGLCQPPDLFATVLELAGVSKVDWAQGNSLVPRLNGGPGTQKFAVGGCHPHRGTVGCLTVITDEWCLVYAPAGGLAGAELFHRPTDPTQTCDVIAQNRPVAEELFGLLVFWLEDLHVPAARREQILHAADFGWMDRMKHRLWMLRNRWSYQRNYCDYARG